MRSLSASMGVICVELAMVGFPSELGKSTHHVLIDRYPELIKLD